MSAPNHECPFPEAEQRPVPEDALALLDDELLLYKDAASMRSNVVGLSRMYKGTALMQGFQRCASLMTIASTTYGLPGAESRTAMALDRDFYSGLVLGTHCMVRPQSYFDRHQLYGWDPLPPFESSEDEGEDSRDLRTAVDIMAEFRAVAWEELFATLAEAVQLKLIEAGVRMYEDQPGAAERENGFMAGFMYAAYRLSTTMLDEEE